MSERVWIVRGTSAQGVMTSTMISPWAFRTEAEAQDYIAKLNPLTQHEYVAIGLEVKDD